MIRELREENEKLKKVLIQMAQGGPINLKELGVSDLSELIETMDENSKAMEDMQKPWIEKLQEEKEKEKEQLVQKSLKEDRRVPHLTNLSDDEQINGKACYSLLDCKSQCLHLQVLFMLDVRQAIRSPRSFLEGSESELIMLTLR